MNRSYFPIFIFLAFFSFNCLAQATKQAAWQQTTNYEIDITLDDQNHILRGFETITYINNSPNTLYEIFIHLWPNAYKNNETSFAKQMLENGKAEFYFAEDIDRGYIDSLDFFINGKGTTWAFDIINIDIAKIILDNPLKPGDSCSISTPFLVKIPKVFSRLGHDKQTYNITQWYPKPAVYDTNGWHAMPYLNLGEFYSEFGSFDVKITLPKNYIVAATGQLMNEAEMSFRNDKGKNTGEIENTYCKTPLKTIQFKQNNIHDFAWFASKNFGILKSSVIIGDKSIETFVFSLKPEDLITNNSDAIKTALVYYSDNAGIYPYSHANVVRSKLIAGGGMEYPMITVCDYLDRQVIIHEVGHNWFYGILGNNERRYPWMDESINSFFESEAMKTDTFSKSQSKIQNFIEKITDIGLEIIALNATRNNTSQAVGITSNDFTELNYFTMVYGKGALVFNHLKGYLGDELFKKCFTTYYETWKYKHPLPGDMKDVFEKVSGQKLDWFFEKLINTNDKLDAKIKSIKYKNKNGGIIIKTNTQLPVPIGFYNKSKVQTILWTQNGQLELNRDFNLKKTTLIIDPNKIIFDANRKNNTYKTKGLLKQLPKIEINLLPQPDIEVKRSIFWLPAVGFNIYNGLLIGAGFHNWSVPQRKFEYMIMPLWGMRNQTLNGYANFNYKITPKNLFQSIDIGVNNASFAYRPFSEPFTFYRTKGFVHIIIKPKNLRSSIRNYIQLEYTNVAARWLEKESKTPDSTRTKPFFAQNKAPVDYAFARFNFIHENKKTINPYSIKFSLESGRYKGDTGYWKPSVEFNFLKTYFKKNRGLAIRIFAGTFITKSHSDLGLFMYRLGAKNGQFDYGMEQTLSGRGATEGLRSSHLTEGNDNMKLMGNLGNFTKGFMVINASSSLPGKIPLRPYIDFCIMKDELFTNKNNQVQKFIYSGGIALDIIPKTFIIYFPIKQSEALEDAQYIQNIKSFGSRICFSLIINDIEPHKFFKRVKLF